MNLKDNRNNDFHYSEPDKIDLIGLISQLWRGKMTIIYSVIFALIIAGSYLAIAKQKWISTAIITQPDAGQISGYLNAVNVIYGGNAPKINEIQQTFIERFNSAFSALAETLDNQERPEKLTIEPSVKGQSLPLKVTYTGYTAENAQKTLAQYIQNVDDEVAKGLEVDLGSSIKARENDLQQFLTTQEKVVTEQKNLRVAQISQALTVAEQAHIKTPQIQQAEQVSQDTMFMLGSDALAAMVENEARRPLPFSDLYYQTRQSLLDVTNLLKGDKANEIKADNLHAYRYVMKPTLPVRRSSPKRVLVIFFALVLGSMMGACIVLGRNVIRNARERDED